MLTTPTKAANGFLNLTNRQPRTERERRWSARLLVIGSGLLILVGLAPVAIGLAGAVALYEICSGFQTSLARRLRPSLAAVVIVCAVLVLVTGPLVWLGDHLILRLPAIQASINALQTSPPNGSTAPAAVAWLGPALAKARSAIVNGLPGVLSSLGSSVGWALLNWSIALLGLYYLLISGNTIGQRLAPVLPFSAPSVETLRVRLHETSIAIVAGTLLSAAIQGASIGFGFFFAGIPEVVFWTLCGAITTLVPLVGNALVWLPALVFMLITKRYDGALAIGVFGGLAPPIIDRVVRASVSTRMGGVHPMVTLVGALAGIRVAGVAGLILGPVALEMFITLVEVYGRDYLSTEADPTGEPASR